MNVRPYVVNSFVFSLPPLSRLFPTPTKPSTLVSNLLQKKKKKNPTQGTNSALQEEVFRGGTATAGSCPARSMGVQLPANSSFKEGLLPGLTFPQPQLPVPPSPCHVESIPSLAVSSCPQKLVLLCNKREARRWDGVHSTWEEPRGRQLPQTSCYGASWLPLK